MYNKARAWRLAATRGARAPNIGDIVVASMTELPTGKAAAADQLCAICGGGEKAMRLSLRCMAAHEIFFLFIMGKSLDIRSFLRSQEVPARRKNLLAVAWS